MQRVLYPFLLSIYFVLFVFSENLGEAYAEDTLRSLGAVFLFTSLSLLIFSTVFKSLSKGGFVTALLLSLIFIHTGIADAIAPLRILSAPILLGIEVIAALALAVIAMKKVKDWPSLNKTLNVVTGALLLLTLYRIGGYGLSDDGVILRPKVSQITQSSEGFTLPESPPNIFYILVDAYARSDVIKKYYGYDNKDFIDFLRGSGFQIADDSYANYHYTYLATNAVLNFEYIADEDGINGEDSATVDSILVEKLINNRTGAIFSDLGYRVVTLQSVGGYVQTAGAEDITLNSRWLTLNEFDSAVLDTTLLPRVFSSLTANLWSDRNKIEFVIDELARQSEREGPMFVLAHIMSPHPPFIYDRDGNTPDISKFNFGTAEHLATDARGYGDQVHHLNTRLEPIIKRILANSRTPPIIILQGDHGLRVSMIGNQLEKRTGIEDACLEELLPNLNAMYLPGASGQAAFYSSISPVNTFRLILDTYFGGSLGLLPDRSFYPVKDESTGSRQFIDVSGKQSTCSAEWTSRFDAIRQAR